MILSEYAKALAARRADRHSSPAVETEPEWPRSVAARAATALDPEPDGTGAWLVAGLVELYDEVNAAGRWHAVTGTNVTAPHGGQLGRLALVYARDADGGAR